MAPVGEPIVEVTRGGTVESVHAIAACAADRDGRVVLGVGNIDVPIFLRSTVKPWFAALLVREGIVERFGLIPEEIAVIAASHSGEPYHLAAVASILRKIGLDEGALQCGGSPSPIHNNCSGKHAGILALCVLRDYDVATYLAFDHPAQRSLLAWCARLCDVRVESLPLGIDGCGNPIFAAPLRAAARAFARFATARANATESDERAFAAVRAAMIAYPAYVSGTGRLDLALAEATNGAIVGKGGAEGVHGAALTRTGIGLVSKVIDGAMRASGPATVALLKELRALAPEEEVALRAVAEPDVHNVAGRVVGRLLIRGVTQSPNVTRP